MRILLPVVVAAAFAASCAPARVLDFHHAEARSGHSYCGESVHGVRVWSDGLASCPNLANVATDTDIVAHRFAVEAWRFSGVRLTITDAEILCNGRLALACSDLDERSVAVSVINPHFRKTVRHELAHLALDLRGAGPLKHHDLDHPEARRRF